MIEDGVTSVKHRQSEHESPQWMWNVYSILSKQQSRLPGAWAPTILSKLLGCCTTETTNHSGPSRPNNILEGKWSFLVYMSNFRNPRASELFDN